MPPSSVAVIGASKDRRKLGNKAVRAYLASGLHALPINPGEATIEGLSAYPTVSAVGAPIDYVSLYVPPAIGILLLPEIAQIAPRELWVNPGSGSDKLLMTAAELGLTANVACSIVALGLSPRQFPDQ